MSLVRGVARNAAGQAVAKAVVTARLVTSDESDPGFQNGGGVVVSEEVTRSAADGTFEFDLIPNAEILLPEGTYYEITVKPPGSRRTEPSFAVSVPAGGPYDVDDILVGEPDPPSPAFVTTVAFNEHVAQTENVHGIEDTAAFVLTDDPRLSDARPPTAHNHDDRYFTETEADARFETPAGSQAKVDVETASRVAAVEAEENAREAHEARVDNPHGVTTAQIGAETPAGAQAKVDAEAAARVADVNAEETARTAADAAVTAAAAADATTKANQAETDAAAYTDTRVTKAVIDTLGIDAATLQGSTLAQIQTAITAAIVDSAPGALDTLNELAAALGDDPNFVTTVTNLIGTKQPLDADLTAIAGVDSSVAGALVTDGAGWIRKTYAQLKTALGLTKADVGLANVDNTSDANKPISTATQTALDAKETPAGAQAKADTAEQDAKDYADDGHLETPAGALAKVNAAKIFANVKDFGAVGDGVADDTTAIQDAIDSLDADYGGTVFFPVGRYKVTTMLEVTDASGDGGRGARFLGAGGMRYRDSIGTERPGGSTLVAATPGMTLIQFNTGGGNYAGPIIDGVHFEESGLGHTTTLVKFFKQNHFRMRNCTVNGGLVGILVDADTADASWGVIDACIVSDNTTNIKVTGDAGGQGTPGVLITGGAVLARAGQVAIDVASNCHHGRIIGVKIDVAGAGSAGIRIAGAALLWTIMGNNLEGSTDGAFIDVGVGATSGRGTRIIGNGIAGTAGPVAGVGIHLRGAAASLVGQVAVIGNHIRDVVTGIKGTYARNCTIQGNSTHGCTTGVLMEATCSTGNVLHAHNSYLDTTDIDDQSNLISLGTVTTGLVETEHENANNTGAFTAANNVHYQRVIRGGLLNKVRIVVAAQNGNIDVGVCKGPKGLNHPTTRVTSSGTTPCPAVGVADITLAAQVYAEPEWHWLAFGSDSATATFRNNGAGTSETDLLKGKTARQATYPIPSSPAPTTSPAKRFVLVGHNV